MAVHCQGILRPYFHRLSAPALVVYLALTCPAAEGRETLNMAFMQGGLALTESEWDARYPAGRYLVDVELNGQRTGRRILDVTPGEAQALCLSPDWLARAGVRLREEVFAPVRDATRGCVVLERFPDVRVNFDFATQRLELHIPQKGLSARPVVTRREYGHSALRMNYSVNGSHTRAGSTLAGLSSLKANLGRWVVDSSVAFTQDSQDIGTVTASRTLESLDADLIVGQGAAGDNMTGSLSMQGIQLRSNHGMRPDSTGYSPVFSGVATSPSRVTLTQGGRTIYTELVPAGPFEIRDVSLLGSGDVEMVVTDEQGKETRERIPLTRLSGQISPGQHEYTLAAGRVDRAGGGTLKGPLASLSYGRGFRALTARFGLTGHERYTGAGAEVVAGAGVAGTVGLTGSLSRARYDDGQTRQGHRETVTWALSPGAGTRIQFSASRRSERYTEAGNFDPQDNPDRPSSGRDTLVTRVRTQKNEQTLQLSLSPGAGTSLGLSAWQRDFWYREEKEKGLTARLSARPGGVGLSLGTTLSSYGGRTNYALSASVSVPFELGGRRYSSGTSMSSGSGGSYGISTGVSGPVTDRLSMGVSAGTGRSGEQSSLDAAWQGDRLRGNATVSRQAGQTRTAGQVSGSVLALPAAGSVVLSSHTQDTVAVAGVPGVPGVRFTGSTGNVTDSRGNVVIPLSGWMPGTVSVDASTLPASVELVTTSQTLTPVSQAVVWLPFEVLKVSRYLLQVRERGGQFVKPGLWAKSEKGTPLGFVSRDGVLQINYVDKPVRLTLGDCVIPTRKLKDTESLQDVVCEPTEKGQKE